jgi:hypothetical protein
MRSLAVVCLFFIGCGGPAPVATQTDGQGASRVLAVAQDLEKAQKTKQAMAAYRQVIVHFPNTPEARKAAERIDEAQRAAILRSATRKSK